MLDEHFSFIVVGWSSGAVEVRAIVFHAASYGPCILSRKAFRRLARTSHTAKKRLPYRGVRAAALAADAFTPICQRGRAALSDRSLLGPGIATAAFRVHRDLPLSVRASGTRHKSFDDRRKALR